MPATPEGETLFRFERFELDSRGGELRRGSELVALARKPAELLVLLVRNRHRVVSRNEILDALWPGVRVSDAAFASALRDLRRALGDRGSRSRFIATVRGRGLRFVAAVEAVRPAAEAPSLGSPYVGRQPLLGALASLFDAARKGKGHVVLLGGEAGIGKTRTALEVAERERARGALTLFASCGGGAGSPPHHPWIQVLGALAQGRSRAELADLVGPRLPDVAPLVPALRDVARAPAPEAEDARFALFDGVATWLRNAAEKTPILMVIDDLHEADRASLRMLEFVAREISTARTLVIATHRTAELEETHPFYATLLDLERQPSVVRHQLRGLDAGEAREFARIHAGREVPGELVEALRARSDGNPFFLRQLVGALDANGDLDGARDAACFVPASLREWARGRLATLSPHCGDTLRAAAVLARDFSLDDLARVTGQEEAALCDALDEARRAGLVAEGSERERRFVHALIQEAVYEETPLPLRSDLHRRAGEALLALASADRPELFSAVAHHFHQAVDLVGPPAVEACARAAEHAEHRLAFAESAHLHELALSALDRVDPADRVRRCELKLGLARAQLGAREVAKACETARRTAALAREIGRFDHLAEAALVLSDHVMVDSAEPAALLEEALASLPEEQVALRARTNAALATHLWYRRQPERRIALAEQGLAAARAHGDPVVLATALLARRHTLNAPELLAHRLRADSEALREAERGGSEAQRCLVLSWRAVDLLESGDLAAAQRDVDGIARIVAGGRARRFLAFPARWAALRAMLAGRFEEAQRAIEQAGASMRAVGDPNAEAYTAIPLGLMLHERGRPGDVMALLDGPSAAWFASFLEHVPALRAGLALIELELGRRSGARRLLDEAVADGCAALASDTEVLGTLSWLAESCAALGDAERAAQLYERASPLRDHVAYFYAIACRGSMARYAGLLARTAGRLDDAERCFEEAVATNRALGADLFTAWSLWDWSQVLALRGRSADRARAAGFAAEAKRMAATQGWARLLRAMRERTGAIAPMARA
jgi:DNA-binding winged helix-turn-helix (wHTH) protein/tetratricopeptide (TPR) repeat protein